MRQSFLWVCLFILLATRCFVFFRSEKAYIDGDRIRLTSRVTSEPIYFDRVQSVTLKGIKISLPKYPEVFYGDYITIEGVVKIRSESGIFSKIFPKWEMKNAKLIRVEENKSFLYLFRENLISVFRMNLPEPDASLVAGVTLGAKSSIPNKFWEALKTTGTAHVIVASGMNVTLVAKFLISTLALFLVRRRALFVAIGGVWMYAVIAGFDAPIIRSAVMGTIVFTAQELGRISSAWRALIISAFAMIFIRPDWISDVGFILSFTATASLIIFEKKVRRWVRFLPDVIRENFSTSFAAQIGVAPVLYFTFGQFNILSPLINATVLWTVVPMTILGMFGGIAGLIFVPLGKVVLWLTYPLTQWFIFVVGLLG